MEPAAPARVTAVDPAIAARLSALPWSASFGTSALERDGEPGPRPSLAYVWREHDGGIVIEQRSWTYDDRPAATLGRLHRRFAETLRPPQPRREHPRPEVTVALIQHSRVDGRHVSRGTLIDPALPWTDDGPGGDPLFTVRDDEPEHATRIVGEGRLITAVAGAAATRVTGYSITSGAKVWSRNVPYPAGMAWTLTGEILLQRGGTPEDLHRTFLDAADGRVLHAEAVDPRLVEQLDYVPSEEEPVARLALAAAPPRAERDGAQFVVLAETGFSVESADGTERWGVSQPRYGKTWSVTTSTQVLDDLVLLHTYQRGASDRFSRESHRTLHVFGAETGRLLGEFRRDEAPAE